MIKLKAPSKECLIYRVVAWLNNKASDTLCVGYEEIKPPQNSCQLWWQSVGWWLVLLNVVTCVAVTAMGVLQLEAGYSFTDMFECLFASVFAFVGVFVGLILSALIHIVICTLSSALFCIVVGVYVILCVVFYCLRDKNLEYQGVDYSYQHMEYTPQGGVWAIALVLHFIGHNFLKLLRKLNIDCEDIK